MGDQAGGMCVETGVSVVREDSADFYCCCSHYLPWSLRKGAEN